MKKKQIQSSPLSSPVLLKVLTAFLLGMITVIVINAVNDRRPVQTFLQPTPIPEKEFTLTEVSEHAEKTDCWQAIDGIVYDFTPYLASGDHPGGGSMIKDCGTDASERYANKPPHSEYARSLLPEYKIGVLK